MNLTCPETEKAELLEDGRLEPNAMFAFKAHATACKQCGHELRVLEQLRAVRHLPVPELTEADQERELDRLLSTSGNNKSNVRSLPRLPRQLPSIVLGAAASVGLVWAGARFWPTEQQVAHHEVKADAPMYSLESGDATKWATLATGHSTRLRLSDGELSVDVTLAEPSQRFVIELPDGELEVKGTRFEVSAKDGATQALSVSEGLVALRLHGQTERYVIAGRAWTRSEGRDGTAASHTSTDPASEGALDESASGSERRNPTATDGEPIPTGVSPPRKQALVKPAPTEAPVSNDTVTDFRACVEAYAAGRFVEAERACGEFTQKHAQDARTEDALYLSIVTQSKLGNHTRVQSLSQAYLRRFPNGLRRQEVERLSRD